MAEDRDTSRLRVQQVQRELAEQRLVQESTREDEAAQHARRADKANYLRSKLEERERSEREAED
jgi:hypothetical protein